MENQSFNELPAVEVFNPIPVLHLRPRTLVRAGVFAASTAVVAALNPRPEYGAYGFHIALLLLFLFGMWLIILGWVAAEADDPDEFYAN